MERVQAALSTQLGKQKEKLEIELREKVIYDSIHVHGTHIGTCILHVHETYISICVLQVHVHGTHIGTCILHVMGLI